MKAMNFQDAREERGLKTRVQQNSLLCSLSLFLFSPSPVCGVCACAGEHSDAQRPPL